MQALSIFNVSNFYDIYYLLQQKNDSEVNQNDTPKETEKTAIHFVRLLHNYTAKRVIKKCQKSVNLMQL